MTLDTISRSNRLYPAHLLGLIALTALAVAPAHADNVSQCAQYGADYVAVAGSNGCVRLGGHVRVTMPRTPVVPMGYAEMRRDGMQQAAARSSLPPMAPFGLHDLFPR
ncbi:hypothetical protein [Methylocystis sp. B8]|uniref:hypothetical protein n=1 Tax=Methylocystis sp. B8 TaxID=544938 RepID=UPI0010FE3ACD|nr:hypothetical protein [Methylocystis sp. B8]TLG78947.1 hypothetical protein FEV16_02660 [Methylocystis sp. B8]